MEKVKRKSNYFIILLFIFLIIPFLSLSGIKNIISSIIYQAWQIISVAILLILLIMKATKIKLNWSIGIFGIYQFIILFSSIFNNGISPGIITVIVASVLIFTLLQTDYYDDMLSAVFIIIIATLVINFLVMLINRNSVNTEYFIGGKNALGIFLIPGLFLVIINSFEKYGKLSKFAVIVVISSLLTIFIGSSGTGIVVASCTILLLLLSIKFKPKKGLYLGIIFTVYALFLLFMDSFLLTEFWQKFTNFIGKDATLTSRTTIWKLAEELIKDNWFIGAGRGVELSYVNTWGVKQTIYEAHNFILEILMEGGIIALVLFAILFFKTIKNLDFKDNRHKIIFIALCILLINGLTESTINGFLVIIILSIACKYSIELKKQL